MRNDDFAVVYVRTETGIRCWALLVADGCWVPGPEQGRNYRQTSTSKDQDLRRRALEEMLAEERDKGAQYALYADSCAALHRTDYMTVVDRCGWRVNALRSALDITMEEAFQLPRRT